MLRTGCLRQNRPRPVDCAATAPPGMRMRVACTRIPSPHGRFQVTTNQPTASDTSISYSASTSLDVLSSRDIRSTTSTDSRPSSNINVPTTSHQSPGPRANTKNLNRRGSSAPLCTRTLPSRSAPIPRATPLATSRATRSCCHVMASATSDTANAPAATHKELAEIASLMAGRYRRASGRNQRLTHPSNN